jgi:hypothetical protein
VAIARGSSTPMVSAHRAIIANSLGRTCGRQRPGGLRRLVAHRLAGRPSPCPSARPRSSRGHAAACPGRCATAEYGRPRPGGVMPPAKSAAPGAWPIPGPGSAAIVPAGRGPHPQAPPGGVRAAGKVESGEYAAIRVRWGLKEERERGAPRPVHGPGKARRASCPPECECPGRLAAPPGRPARWRVGSCPPSSPRPASCPGEWPASCRPARGRGTARPSLGCRAGVTQFSL